MDTLLVLNAGSSSLKFAVYDFGLPVTRLIKGSVSRLHHEPRMTIRSSDGQDIKRRLLPGSMRPGSALKEVFLELDNLGLRRSIRAVGHRIVHGGRDFTQAAQLNAQTLSALRQLIPLAPLHQSANLDIVDAVSAYLPTVEQFACFDTSFHSQRPVVDRLYGIPKRFADEGVVAYGFHGLSYEYIASVLSEQTGSLDRRVIVAHLGSGASLCAMKAGRSIATTMGFSALDGLIMSTRCGSIDPGVILYLMSHHGMSHQDLTDLLYKRSGLLGLSGASGDMQELLEGGNAQAITAIDLFIYRINGAIGSLTAALNGLDTLVFTAGIGENSPIIRQRVCEAAQWLGLNIDKHNNQHTRSPISTPVSDVEVLVIPTDEEHAVATGVLSRFLS